MTIEETLPERVRKKHHLLSQSQRTIARYCTTQPSKAGNLTALRIADELGVSESTVVRFAVKMGYRGFPDMQAAIRASAPDRATTGRSAGLEYPETPVHGSLRNDLEALEQSIHDLDIERLRESADALDNATNVFICGFRTSFSLAYLAAFHIRRIHPSVGLLGDVGGTMADDLELLAPGDALLAFTFPVYDDRTIHAIEYATKIGVPSVVVTDSALAPIPIDDLVHSLMVRHDSQSFFNSNVSATAVLNAMVVRLVELRSSREPTFEQKLSTRFHKARGES